MNSNIRWENGLNFLERLQRRQYIKDLEPALFPESEFQPGSVVEVCGKSGVGKSELLLNLIAKCLLPVSCTAIIDQQASGRRREIPRIQGRRVVYVDNDHHFSMLRFATILRSRISKALNSPDVASTDVDELRSQTCETALKNLTLLRCTSSRQLLTTLHHLEEIAIHEEPFFVLVVDSISAFYWEDRMIFGHFKALCEHHRRMCQVIRRLSVTHKVSVFCTNQDLVKREAIVHGDEGETTKSVMGRDFTDLWNWKVRLTRSDPPSPAGRSATAGAALVNRVVAEVRHKDRLIRRTTFDIADGGISFA